MTIGVLFTSLFLVLLLVFKFRYLGVCGFVGFLFLCLLKVLT